MRLAAFLIDYAAINRVIDYLKLVFVAEEPPRTAYQELLIAAEKSAEYSSRFSLGPA